MAPAPSDARRHRLNCDRYPVLSKPSDQLPDEAHDVSLDHVIGGSREELGHP